MLKSSSVAASSSHGGLPSMPILSLAVHTEPKPRWLADPSQRRPAASIDPPPELQYADAVCIEAMPNGHAASIQAIWCPFTAVSSLVLLALTFFCLTILPLFSAAKLASSFTVVHVSPVSHSSSWTTFSPFFLTLRPGPIYSGRSLRR